MKNEKTTLIVVPSNLVNFRVSSNFHGLTALQRTQWLREIKYHAPVLGENVMQFRSALEDNSATRLKSNDIVLTTYWEVCQSLPNPDRRTVLQWETDKLDLFREYQKWVKEHADHKGLLHQIKWYRVRLHATNMKDFALTFVF